MKKLGTPQHIVWLQYLDCKSRTKRNIEFPKESKGCTDDERLVRFMLENSSITESHNERAFRKVADAIDIACKQLCPGQWCTRSHCKDYSTRSAYNCSKTRPKVCKEYAKYIKNKKLREEKDKTSEKEE